MSQFWTIHLFLSRCCALMQSPPQMKALKFSFTEQICEYKPFPTLLKQIKEYGIEFSLVHAIRTQLFPLELN